MSVSDDILQALGQGGPMALQQIFEATGHKKKTIQSKLYELRQAGKVARTADGVYEGLAAAPPEENDEPDILPPAAQGRSDPQLRTGRDTPGPQAPANPLRQPLSGDQEKFRALLQDCDVRKALDTITETFFAGDVDVSSTNRLSEMRPGRTPPSYTRLMRVSMPGAPLGIFEKSCSPSRFSFMQNGQ